MMWLIGVFLAMGARAEEAPALIMKKNPDLRMRAMAAGDLNGDSLVDYAAILSDSPNDEASAPYRDWLIVYLAESGGGLREAGRSAASPIHIQGSGLSLPLADAIKAGVLEVRYAPSDEAAATVRARWRFQNGAMSLVSLVSNRVTKSQKNEIGVWDAEEITTEVDFTARKAVTTVKTLVEAPKDEGDEPKFSSKKIDCAAPTKWNATKLDGFAWPKVPRC